MREFSDLSTRQHRNVMLTRDPVQDTKVLLLDDPASNLNIRHRIGVTKMLKQFSTEKGVLILMIGHGINIAAKYSDRRS